MIQFNLLPDVKKQYVKAKRTKRLILSVSTLASIGAVGVTVLMYTFVHFAQKGHINRLTDNINEETTAIQYTPNLNKILTVQNQLSLFPGLHTAKPETSRLFGYLSVVSPEPVRITTTDLDVATSLIRIEGSADSIATVNKLVDNIKAANYAVVGSEASEGTPAFSSIGTDLSGNNDGANFTIDMTYDPALFNNTEQVVLRIGSQAETQPVEGEQ